jgi:hypothetical protein
VPLLTWSFDAIRLRVNRRRFAKLLTTSVRLAHQIESAVDDSGITPISLVSFGTLVRMRRNAEAVLRLGANHSYESRVIVRSMLEMYFNLAWIHVEDHEVRARRFLEYHTLEKLSILRRYPESMRSPQYPAKVRQLEEDRDKLSHFRIRNRQGQLTWAKSWATVTSVEGRIAQVQESSSQKGSPRDDFMYLLYQWFSGVVHGSPQSIAEVLDRSEGHLKSKDLHDLADDRSITGAALSLILVMKIAISDLQSAAAHREAVDQLYRRATDRIHGRRK